VKPTRVQRLTNCLVDQFFPETGMAVVAVLEGLGLTGTSVTCPLTESSTG
jgi:hypothetical protein